MFSAKNELLVGLQHDAYIAFRTLEVLRAATAVVFANLILL